MKSLRIKNKKYVVNAMLMAFILFLMNLKAVNCDPWEQIYNNRGWELLFEKFSLLYFAVAWLPGVAFFIRWLQCRDDKLSATLKKGWIGIIGGYIVLGMGYATISGVFQSFGQMFTP